MTTPDPRTNFAQYSHQRLYAMLYAGNPDSARTAAATWNDTGNGLHDQANQLSNRLNGFSQDWQGGAADQYRRMMQDLIGGLQKVADTAYQMRDVAYDIADAQDTARAQMPVPVDVPTLPAATVALASAPIQIDAGTPASVVAQIQQARATAITAVQGQQQASAAADAAHAKAVQVMTTLAGAYVSAHSSMPASPAAAMAPTLAAGSGIGNAPAIGAMTSANTAVNPATLTSALTRLGTTPNLSPGTPSSAVSGVAAGGTAGGTAAQPENPLFGDMFSAGVAAASAAVFGRFGSLVPKIPGFVNKDKNGGGSDPNATNPDGSTPKLGDRVAAEQAAAAKIGGGGGGASLAGLKGIGGGGGLGGIGGGGIGAPTPSASASLLGASNVSGDVAAGVAGAAGVAAKSATGMPMMPMMPMSGGMGGNDMGGGRRIPPWLVETEDVWGESSAVSPTVIGEDHDLGGQGWLG